MGAVGAQWWTRAGAVAILAVTLIVASQVLAGVEPDRDARVTATGDAPAPTPTTAPPTTAPAPASPTTAPLPPITGPVRLDDTARIDGRGIGVVEAGMTVAEAEQSAGRRFDIVDRTAVDTRCYAVAPQGLNGLRFGVRGPADDPRTGEIVRIDATDATWATVSDVRVGSPIADVKRSYGRRAVASPDGKALTVTVKDGGRSFAVLFVTSERGVVAAIRSGELAAVTQPEGCG